MYYLIKMYYPINGTSIDLPRNISSPEPCTVLLDRVKSAGFNVKIS